MADERIPFATHAESTVLGADEIVLNMGALDDLAEDGVLACEPVCRNHRDEEL